ncbi:transcriptional regulator BetI [compost metagenome]|jgi:AcrR family transcriptional regulator|uniref:TetR/AcrR family transcriptional regulator n=1 Tax=Pseudomonas TaxID=286 RepID=UPI0009813580|nr:MULTISPECIES: TetR/AcrR family transcriptional regulator [Pseudomonas]OMQ41002.1 TetR family transcriptional regulator [Pseudomonas putida]
MDTPDQSTPNTTRRSKVEMRAQAEHCMLEAARQIVARKGWIGITLAEVGLQAGYSRGLAAHHFGTKAGLLRALAGFVNTRFMDVVEDKAPRREPGLDTLLGYIDAYFLRDDAEWTNARALLALMAEGVTVESESAAILAEYNHSVRLTLAKQVEIGIANGEIPADTDPLTAATLLIGTMRGMMLQLLLDPSTADPALLHKQLRRLIKTLLTSPCD